MIYFPITHTGSGGIAHKPQTHLMKYMYAAVFPTLAVF